LECGGLCRRFHPTRLCTTEGTRAKLAKGMAEAELPHSKRNFLKGMAEAELPHSKHNFLKEHLWILRIKGKNSER
jgi:hypothetical protein